jgi:hypothetical protein
MKWQHKGHEFDELGSFFKKNSRIFIAGTACENEDLCKKLSFLDANIETSEFIPNGSKLFDEWLEKNKLEREGKIVILNYRDQKSKSPFITKIKSRLNRKFTEYILRKFLNTGKYKQNVNIFLAEDFIQKYLSVFAWYVCGKVYLYNIGIIITTVCNLNCTYCLNFNPYNKKTKHIDLEQLKRECDSIFKNVDKLMYFSLSGGEPLLYPEFGELLKYINLNYRHKMHYLGPAANGTIVPSDELCAIFHDCDVTIICDNYVTVKKTRSIYPRLIKQLCKFNVKHEINNIKKFHKTFPSEKDWSRVFKEKDFIDRYDRCGTPGFKVHFTDVKNGRLYGCCYTEYAETAGLIQSTADDYFDLNRTLTDTDKKELIEFKLGYCNKGFSSLCQYCNELTASKPDNGVEQAKGKLSWEVINPTVFTNK